MGPLGVVATEPVMGDRPDLGEGAEDVGVEDLGAIGPVEAFDESVLRRLAGLNEIERDAVHLGPFLDGQGEKLGTVVHQEQR